MTRLLTYWLLLCVCVIAQPELTNTEATNIDQASERQAWREALELWTDDSPTFTGGTYTGNLLVSGKLNVGNGAIDDTHIVNFVSQEDVVTEVMLHLEWNSPTPLAGDSNALLFSMYDSALNETEYSRFRSVIEDPTDGSEDGAMTVDVLNDGVLEQAVLFSHDEIIMNDNGADRNFIVKDDDTNEVFRITGGNGSIAMDGSTLFVDSANNRVGIGTNTPTAGYALNVNGNALLSGNLTLDTNGGSGTEGILAFDDGYGAPTLIQQIGGDIITFTDGNNNGSHDSGESFFLNYSIGGGVLGLGGTDAYSAAVSVGTNFLYMGSGLTIYNPFTVAGQVEMTGQSASTDDSAMTRSLVDTDRWLASSRIWSPSYTPAFANSGTGSLANTVAGELIAALDSGTSNSGYGKARLARGLNSAPGYSGAGIYFNREIGISLKTALVTASTETNVFRIIVGASIEGSAPAAADSDPISDDGFGVEVRYDGTNTEWRVFGHNGTTLTASAWTDLYTGNRLYPQMFAVYSNGSGTITAYNTTYGGNSYTTISTTGGPTTTGASATSFVSAECVNASTGTTSTRCKIYDAKFFTP